MKKNYVIWLMAAMALIAVLYFVFNRPAQPTANQTIGAEPETVNLAAPDNNEQTNSQATNNTTMNDQQEITTAEGLKIKTLAAGSGPVAKNGDRVSVHYTGTFTDGQKFDSSLDRGTPFSFRLGAGEVIKGWDLGVAGMQAGEKRLLTVPYDLGYGADGYGPIPAQATLIFEVELLSIN